MRFKRFLWIGAISFVLVSTFLYFLALKFLEYGIQKVCDDLRCKGYAVSYVTKSTGGFPFTYRIYLHDVGVNKKDSWQLKTPLVKISATPLSLIKRCVSFSFLGSTQVLLSNKNQSFLIEGLKGVVRPLHQNFLFEGYAKKISYFEQDLVQEDFYDVNLRFDTPHFSSSGRLKLSTLNIDQTPVKGRFSFSGFLKKSDHAKSLLCFRVQQCDMQLYNFFVKGYGDVDILSDDIEARLTALFQTKGSFLAFFHKLFAFELRRNVEIQEFLNIVLPEIFKKRKRLTLLIKNKKLCFEEFPWFSVALF